MNAVDTNVLVYSYDPRDPAKQAVASSLIGSLADGILLWQVICEFVAASRKLEPFGYDVQQGILRVHELGRAWKTAFPDWATLDVATDLMQKRSLSIWDALILSACLQNEVKRLYSEDLDTHNGLGGMEIINPFRSSNGKTRNARP
jgi:predicted nucleic acid-binding protein